MQWVVVLIKQLTNGKGLCLHWKPKTTSKPLLINSGHPWSGGGGVVWAHRENMIVLRKGSITGNQAVQEAGFQEEPQVRHAADTTDTVPSLVDETELTIIEIAPESTSTSVPVPDITVPPNRPDSPVPGPSNCRTVQRERSPISPVASTPRRHRVRQRRLRQTPFDRATSEFVAIEKNRLLDESINAVDAATNVIDASMNAIDASSNVVKTSTDAIDASTDAVDVSMNAIDASMDTVDAAMKAVDATMNTIDAAMNTIDASKNAIDATIDTIEASLNIVDSSIDAVDASMNIVDASMNTVGATTDTVNVSIDAVGASTVATDGCMPPNVKNLLILSDLIPVSTSGGPNDPPNGMVPQREFYKDDVTQGTGTRGRRSEHHDHGRGTGTRGWRQTHRTAASVAPVHIISVGERERIQTYIHTYRHAFNQRRDPSINAVDATIDAFDASKNALGAPKFKCLLTLRNS
ncbi:hypothetical protein SFRURICE_011807 [Spodoptera frugiperda]|nr:hypothetical protein SFRURICE_011807 [Spodoptera frugiperda]